MPLSLLLDEHMSDRVSNGVKRVRPDLRVVNMQSWNGGTFLGVWDAALLRAARSEGLTLVTYDQKTMPALLTEWGLAGEPHAGVVLVDHRTIAQNDIGGLVRAIIDLIEETGDWDWTNRISFLKPAL